MAIREVIKKRRSPLTGYPVLLQMVKAPSLAGALRQPPRSAPVATPSYSVVLPRGTDVAVCSGALRVACIPVRIQGVRRGICC